MPAGVPVGPPGGDASLRRAAHPAHGPAAGHVAEDKTRFHLPDGARQRERDARMAAGVTDWSFDAVAWIYEHDAAVVPT